jgi:hypothetical protein
MRLYEFSKFANRLCYKHSENSLFTFFEFSVQLF